MTIPLARARPLAVLALVACAALASAEDAVVIRAGVLIDGKGMARRNQVIVVRGNRIEASGDEATVSAPAGGAVLDLSRATVLPGLIDSHTHVFLQGEDPKEGGYDAQLLRHGLAYRAARATASARRALEQGFTTIRDLETEAHGWGKKVACHAYGGEGLHRALDGGCDSIEHGLDLDDAAIAQIVKQGTWYCPTLAVYYDSWGPADTPSGSRDRKRVEVHGPSFQKAMKAGVKIVFGTDVGGFSWSEPIAQEFPRMVELGMSPRDAIRSATTSAAEMLGMSGQIGVIAPGAYADIVAVVGDPLADISVLKGIAFVMKDGKVFRNELR